MRPLVVDMGHVPNAALLQVPSLHLAVPPSSNHWPGMILFMPIPEETASLRGL